MPTIRAHVDSGITSAVWFSISFGRPVGESYRKGNTVTWCAWWSAEPTLNPITPPDLSKGAPSREAAPALIERLAKRAGAVGELKELPPRYAQAVRKAVKAERDAKERAKRAEAEKRWNSLPFEEQVRRRFGFTQTQWDAFQAGQRAAERERAHVPPMFDPEVQRRLEELFWRSMGSVPSVFEVLGAVPTWATTLGLAYPHFTRADVVQAFRSKAFEAHPDRGGSHEAFVALNDAKRRALAHLGCR